MDDPGRSGFHSPGIFAKVRPGTIHQAPRKKCTMTNRLKMLFSRSARKAAIIQDTGLVNSAPDRRPKGTTRTQELFVEWNADRLGIPLEESRRRYAASQAVFPGGHIGKSFRQFTRQFAAFRVFADDSPGQVFDTYQLRGPIDFLRFLTYPERQWRATDLIVQQLPQQATRLTIMDFGCGLAQQSRTLAEYLRDQGHEVSLYLADIETLRADFLTWWGRKTGIPTTFLPCTQAQPIPELPAFDVCFTLEFFEHVYEPMKYFERIDARLARGGLLLTGVMDHHADFLHVTPQLQSVRDAIHARGYVELVSNRIFRKGI